MRKTIILVLLGLLCSVGNVWGEDSFTSLRTVDFTALGKYTNFSTSAKANYVTETGYTDIVFYTTNSSKIITINSSAGVGVDFAQQNYGSSSFIAIPLTGVNGKIKVTFHHQYSSAKAKFKVGYVDGATSYVTNASVNEAQDGANADTQCSWTSGTLTDTKGYLYVGEAGTGYRYLKKVVIETLEASGKSKPNLSVSPTSVTKAIGGTQQITVTNNDGDGTISYTSSNTSVATVSAAGLITAVGNGSATITVASTETSTYEAGSASVNVIVKGSDPTILQYAKFNNGLTNSPEGFVTIDGDINYNSNYTGTYDGTDFTKGLKMQSSTVVNFSTLNSGTLVVVQSTKTNGTKNIKIDNVDFTTNYGNTYFYDDVTNNVRVYICPLAAGDHTIKRASDEMGILYVGVTSVSKPSISASNVNIAASATGGSIAYTINNSVDGGVLTAAKNGEADWVTSVGTEATSPISFTTTTNSGIERSATIRLTYTYNTDKTVTKDVTITQAAPTFTITEGSHSNGTITISPSTASLGGTVNLTATPSSGYAFVGWQIVKTSDSKDITGLVSLSDAANPKATFTMPGYGVTVNATFAAPNIYYYKDETHYSGGSYKNPEGGTASSGDDISLSTSWTICNACVVGVESVIAKNCTYDGKGSYVDAYIKIPTGGDKDSKNITFKISDGYSAVLKMKMGPWSGTPTITFKKLEGGTLGDNIAYTGTIGGNAQSENNFNELTWSIPSGGTYVMTVTTKNTYVSQIDIQTTQVVTVTDAQYATYYNEKAYVMPTGLEGYAVTAANTTTGALTLAKAYDAGDVVIANEPLVLHATTVLASETTFTLNNTSASGSSYSGNLLSGERDGNGKTTGGELYYRLSYNEADYSDLGFYWGAAGGAAFEIAKGKAYLPLNAGANAPSRFLFTDQEDNATNIENIEASDKAIKFIENGQLLILRDGIVYDALGRKIR